MKRYLFIALNLILGGMMFYGGIKKFEKPTPPPTEIIDTVKSGQEVAPTVEILKIKNYIFGMRQSGFFWEFLGIAELLAGILLISQVFARVGAFVALPLTINIFLFHLFLEPHEVGELLQTLGLLVINLVLIAESYRIWKPLLWNPRMYKSH